MVPVPERAMPREGLLASEVRVNVPLAVPAEDGAKDTLKVTLCPADRVVGKESPVTLNAAELELAPEIVTLEPPEFVTVSELEVPFPTCTEPNDRLDGFEPSIPADAPVPLSGIVSVGFEPSEVIVRLPDALPLDDGENLTVKLAD